MDVWRMICGQMRKQIGLVGDQLLKHFRRQSALRCINTQPAVRIRQQSDAE
jgi:hypothetical protein